MLKNIVRYKRFYGVTAVVYFFLIGWLKPSLYQVSDRVLLHCAQK